MELSLPFLSCLSILAAYLSDKELLQFSTTNKTIYGLLKKDLNARLKEKICSLVPSNSPITIYKLGGLFKSIIGMDFSLATGKSLLGYIREHRDIFEIQNKNQRQINGSCMVKVVRRGQTSEEMVPSKKRKIEDENREDKSPYKKGKIEKAKLTVVLDTNCLMHKLSECEHIYNFIKKRNGQLVIPDAVFRELDGLKNRKDKKTQGQARTALRFLATKVNTFDLKAEISPSYALRMPNDDKIVECSVELDKNCDNDTFLVSNDNGVIYLAKSKGIKSMPVIEFCRLMRRDFSCV